jgi:hypothetical protein
MPQGLFLPAEGRGEETRGAAEGLFRGPRPAKDSPRGIQRFIRDEAIIFHFAHMTILGFRMAVDAHRLDLRAQRAALLPSVSTPQWGTQDGRMALQWPVFFERPCAL